MSIFRWINVVGNKVGNKNGLTTNRTKIIKEIRNNPNITTVQLANNLCVSKTAINNNLKHLKQHGYIKRNGLNNEQFRILGSFEIIILGAMYRDVL